jgi:uncharacterized membrane protein
VLELTTLDGLTIQRAGDAVVQLITHKVEAVLVYLACTSHTHARAVLAERLGKNAPPNAPSPTCASPARSS